MHRIDSPQPRFVSFHRRFSAVVNRIGERFFRRVPLAKEHLEHIRALSRQGTVVYLGRRKSHLLYVYLLYTLTWAGLPQPAWASGVFHWIWQPLGFLWHHLKMLSQAGKMAKVLQWNDKTTSKDMALIFEFCLQNESSIVFAEPSLDIAARQKKPAVDYLLPLIKAQALLDSPIYVVPCLLLTSHEPPARKLTAWQALRDTIPFLGFFSEFFQFLLAGKDAMARLGREVNLQQLASSFSHADDEALCLEAFQRIKTSFFNEERVAVGPPLENLEDAVAQVKKDSYLESYLGQQKLNKEEQWLTEKKIKKYVAEIAARYRIRYIKFLDYIVQYLTSRLYDQLVVDELGLKKASEVMRDTPLIICASHKSHLDYLVISHLFYHYGITPPHIAAGVNLSFWPLGPIFRGCGAFFLRRSFRGNPLYSLVFKAYVKYLLREKHSIEFFIEGGRSRTGKLLMPTFGMLGMVTKAWQEGACEDLHVLPVAVDYERLVELGSYTYELKGGKKRSESIKSLLASRKLLKTKYGRIYVHFGNPVRLSEFYSQNREQLLNEGPLLEEEQQRKYLLQKLAFKTMHEIGQAAAVTPTAIVATALLINRKRAISHQRFQQLVRFLSDFLFNVRARFAPYLQEQLDDIVNQVMAHLVRQGQVIQESVVQGDEWLYRVKEDSRLELDYYKNNVMQHLIAPGIVCKAILQHSSQSLDYKQVQADALFLSRLLKREFFFEATRSFEENFEVATAVLAVHGYIEINDEPAIICRDMDEIRWLAATVDSYVEAYWAVVQSIAHLRKFPLWEKEFLPHCISTARKLYLLGELNCIEAANKSLAKNGIEWLVENGYLVATQERGAKRTLSIVDDEQALQQFSEHLSRFLPNKHNS